MKNALTFDIEEYFHAEAFAEVVRPEEWPGLASRVVRSTERVLDLLEAASVRATFFVLGWVAERKPALVRDIHGRGHEVACHGYGHRMIRQLSRVEFEADVSRAKAAIEDAIGSAVIGYRAPTFSVVRKTLWSLEVLCELGFRYDSSIFPIHHDRYGIPDAPRFPHRLQTPTGGKIVEFPLSTVVLGGLRFPVAGGGYFRLLPYAVTRWALRRLNGMEERPAIVYLHPWEMDPDQPRLPGASLTRVRHFVNVRTTEAKLARLLCDFQFAPVREILSLVGMLLPEDAK